MTKDDSGQAFPFNFYDTDSCGNNVVRESFPGMTLRQWYAGMALQGLLSQSPSGFLSSHKSVFSVCINSIEKGKSEEEQAEKFFKPVVDLCYGFADALIAEGQKGGER